MNIHCFEQRNFGEYLKYFTIFVVIAAVIAAVTVFTVRGERRGLLEQLPPPSEAAPSLVISSGKGAFPLGIFRLFADSATVLPSGTSPISAISPVFSESDSAVVVTERDEGLAMYGVLRLAADDAKTLERGSLPHSWTGYLTDPSLTITDGVVQISAADTASSMYIAVAGSLAFVADTASDIERVKGILSGKDKGISRKWTVEKKWEGHLLISDGGILAGVLSGTGSDRGEALLSAEAAWHPFEKEGEAAWRVFGMEHYLEGAFMSELRGFDWKNAEMFIPDPLITAFGINLPDMSAAAQNAPQIVRALIDYLIKIGLTQTEARAAASGPTSVSVGGRTQILWFDLPGIIIDLADRGDVARKVVERFWADTFMGASPRPVDGYEWGGTTDLPFTVTAAANEKKAIIGITQPDSPQNDKMKQRLASLKDCAAWLFVDMPKLATLLSDMPSVKDMFYEDEESSAEDEAVDSMRDVLSKLGSVLVMWDTPETGRIVWN
ncbi:hypothetical protein FACS1894167_09640 [Synergistales bacterium]|nr:hypothetical protein FACS1894167_09640 [Synergistales bacterium]